MGIFSVVDQSLKWKLKYHVCDSAQSFCILRSDVFQVYIKGIYKGRVLSKIKFLDFTSVWLEQMLWRNIFWNLCVHRKLFKETNRLYCMFFFYTSILILLWCISQHLTDNSRTDTALCNTCLFHRVRVFLSTHLSATTVPIYCLRIEASPLLPACLCWVLLSAFR